MEQVGGLLAQQTCGVSAPCCIILCAFLVVLLVASEYFCSEHGGGLVSWQREGWLTDDGLQVGLQVAQRAYNYRDPCQSSAQPLPTGPTHPPPQPPQPKPTPTLSASSLEGAHLRIEVRTEAEGESGVGVMHARWAYHIASAAYPSVSCTLNGYCNTCCCNLVKSPLFNTRH